MLMRHYWCKIVEIFYMNVILLFFFPSAHLFVEFLTVIFIFFFPLYSKGVRLSLHVYIAITVFSPTLSSVAAWVSRHSSQCYSAGSPCKSILGCSCSYLLLSFLAQWHSSLNLIDRKITKALVSSDHLELFSLNTWREEISLPCVVGVRLSTHQCTVFD